MTPTIGAIFDFPFSFQQEEIDRFAALTGDMNPLHVDPSYAQQSEFGGCIAHGVLTLGVFSRIFGTQLFADGHVLVSVEAKFIGPILPNKEYIARVRVSEVLEARRQVIYETSVMTRIDEKPALLGRWRLQNKQHYVVNRNESEQQS